MLVLAEQGDWGATVLPVLRRAASLTPRIDGEKALFEDGDGTVFVLYRSEGGGLGFHL